MSTEAPSGHRPIQIVKIDDESDEHNFFLDEEALNEILNKNDIKDKPICIISVAGEYLLCFRAQKYSWVSYYFSKMSKKLLLWIYEMN